MNKLHFTQDMRNNAVHNIIQQMAADNWKPDYIVGITRGGLVPALYLSKYLNIPMETIKICFRDLADNENNTESNLWMSEEAFGYDHPKKKILVVDDINDTGATLNWLIKDWQSSAGKDADAWNDVWGNNVRFATLVDNLSSDFIKKVDYSALEINKAENDVWVVFPEDVWWERN